jgi:hypothetical protein
MGLWTKRIQERLDYSEKYGTANYFATEKVKFFRSV